MPLLPERSVTQVVASAPVITLSVVLTTDPCTERPCGPYPTLPTPILRGGGGTHVRSTTFAVPLGGGRGARRKEVPQDPIHRSCEGLQGLFFNFALPPPLRMDGGHLGHRGRLHLFPMPLPSSPKL